MEDITRCSGCMEIMEEGRFCTHCGYDNGTVLENPLFLRPGTKIGEYLFGKVLGHGGFGITYLGYDYRNNRKVAIKEYLPAELATRQTDAIGVSIYMGDKEKTFKVGVEKFKKEAEMLKNFSDFPGIVDGYDLFEANNTAYFVMEYIEGVTLKEYAQQMGGRLPFETVRTILMPVIDALAEMHRKDILHRDISPDNIYITAGKQVKLLDFGAARQTVHDQDSGLTVILKHGFTPKEQYFTKGNQGPWTDVYALGATAYFLMTGKVPQSALDRIEQDKLVPITSFVPVSPQVDTVIRKALAVEEFNRYQLMKDFKSALLNPESQTPVFQNYTGQSVPVQPGYPNYSQQGVPVQPEQPVQQQVNPNYSQQGTPVPPVYQNYSQQGAPVQPAYQNYSQGMPSQPVNQLNQNKPVKKKKKIVFFVAIPILVIALAVAGIYIFMPKVPDVIGKSSDDAIEALQGKGFIVEDENLKYEYSDKIAKDEVISQKPVADKKTFKKEVRLIVSQGPEMVMVPNVVGMTKEVATKALNNLNLEAATTEIYSSSETGLVVEMDINPGEEVDSGTKVTLTVSKGQDPNIIVIQDENFMKAAKLSMKLSEDEVITKDMAKLVTELNLSFSEISSLEGIEAFTNLENLNASDNQLTEVPTLPETLVDINLSYNQLTDLDVSNCLELYYLNVSRNSLSTLPQLPTGLEFLNVSENIIVDITEITNLTKLYSVDLSYNSIEDFTPLEDITYEISYIYTDGNTGTYKTDLEPGSWMDSIYPTLLETEIISTNYTEDHNSYYQLSLVTTEELVANEDVVYNGPYENDYGKFDIYSLEYEDGSIDFYMDTTTDLCSFYEVYGASFPYLGYDILCQLSTNEDLFTFLGSPSDLLTGDGYVYVDYVDPELAYRFSLNQEGIVDSMVILNYNYYTD